MTVSRIPGWLMFLAALLALSPRANAQQPFEPLNPPSNQNAADPASNPQDGLQDDDFVPPDDEDPVTAQSVLINAKYAGWEGADAAASEGQVRIGERLRRNWVMVDPNGAFGGNVLAGSGADVTNMNVFLMNNGRLVKQTTVDDSGRFMFSNVRQGSYALIGWGEAGFFCFGLNILTHNPDNDGSIGNEVNVTAFQNRTTINTDWIKFYANRVAFRVYGRYPTGEGRNDPESLYGFRGQFSMMPTADAATSLSSQDVVKTADNRLIGRVHQLNSFNGRPVDVRSTRVLLMEDDSVVAATSTDNFGVFEFQEVPPGSYGVLAAGVDGVGLISINVVDSTSENAEELNASLIDFTMVPSETIGWLNHYAEEIAYRRGLMAPRPKKQQTNPYGYGFNNMGGCAACQGRGRECTCRSRNLTFEQWLASCQDLKLGFGDGEFFRAVGDDFRRRKDRIDNYFDDVFYPTEGGFGGGPAYNGVYYDPGRGYIPANPQGYYGNGTPGYNPGNYGNPGYYGNPGFGTPGVQPQSFGPAPGTLQN